MSRLLYADIVGTLGGSGLSAVSTTHTFAAPLTYAHGVTVPTLTGTDFFLLTVLAHTGRLAEVVQVTAYNAGTGAATIVRGQEGTSGIGHAPGRPVTSAVYPSDVAAVLAVGTTNDAVIAAKVADTSSATRAALNASYVLLSQKAAASGVASLDATTKIPVAQVPYMAVAEAPYNPERSGVVSDGTTDDTTAMQSALSVVRAAKGVMRLGRNKTTIISGVLNPTGIVIDGYGHTFKEKAGVTAAVMLQPTGAFTCLGLTIDMNKANNTDPGSDTNGNGIYCFASAGWTGTLVLRDMTIKDGYRNAVRLAATGVTDAATAPLGRTLIENLTVDNCKYGVFANYLTGVKIRDSNITGTTADAILASVCNKLKVENNSLSGAGGNGFGGSYLLDAIIRGNDVRGCSLTGISNGGGSTTVAASLRVIIEGNSCEGNTQHGITVDPTKTGASAAVVPSYTVIGNNICRGNVIHGINLTNPQHVVITGNECHANTNSGIALSAADTTVSGNHCVGNNRGIALHGNASFPNYGRHRLGVNTVAGNTSNGYYVEGASVTDIAWASLTTTNPAP
jgi:hypothetical protein